MIDRNLIIKKMAEKWHALKALVNIPDEIDFSNGYTFNRRIESIKECLETNFRFTSNINLMGEYMTPFTFLLRYMTSYSGSKIYVINCVDFHW